MMTQKSLMLLTVTVALMVPTLSNAKNPEAKEKKPVARSVAQSDLRWSPTRETCVFYDYRSMIEAGQSIDLYFAIEPQNYNGGSREFSYKRKDFKSAKEAYLKAFGDLNGLMQSGRCDAFSIFYPTAEKPDAPL
jgi:hypothetical protein